MTETTPSTEKPTFLHVEDEKSVHNVVSELLKDLVLLELAQTPKSALRLIAEGRFSGLILDGELLNGHGGDVGRENNKAENPLPVIIFSGKINDSRWNGVDNVVARIPKSQRSQLPDAVQKIITR